MQPAAVLFDLDGTIVDSRMEILDALTIACEAAGLRDVRPRLQDIGLAVKDIVRLCAPGVSDADLVEVERQFRLAYDARPHDLTPAYPGIVEIVRTLAERGIPTGVATMKPKKPTAVILARIGIAPYLTEVRSSDSWEGPRLTKAELLERMVVEMRTRRGATIYVGDHPDDMAAARRSGIKSVAALYGYGDPALMRAAKPDGSIGSPAELAVLLDTMTE